MFAKQVGFGGAKQNKLLEILGALPDTAAGLDGDHVPGLAAFIRKHCGSRWVDKEWLGKHNIDRLPRWRRHGAEILSHIADPDVRAIAQDLTDGRFTTRASRR